MNEEKSHVRLVAMGTPDRDAENLSDAELAQLRQEAALADLGRLLSMARRRWRWLLLLPLSLALVAGLLSAMQDRRYSATATLTLYPIGVVGPNDDRSAEVTERELRTEANLLNSEAMEVLLEAELGAELSYTAETVSGTDLMAVSAEAPSAERAAAQANRVSEAYLEYRRQLVRTELERQTAVLSASAQDLVERIRLIDASSPSDSDEIDRLSVELTGVRATIDELVRETAVADGGARVISEAVVPKEPFAPNTLRSVILALIVGLLLAATIGWLRERADKRLRSLGELEGFSGRLECLGQVGRPRVFSDPGPVILTEEPLAEQFRVIASNLAQRDNRSYVIQIAGVHGAEGASYVAVNLAATLAVGGWNTVVVDADMNGGQVHRVFGVGPRPGLKQLLAGEQLTTVVQRSSVVSDLGVIAAGSQVGTSVSVHGTGLALTLERLAAHFDIVIVDGPPMLSSGDASILAHHVDKTVLVAAIDSSDRSDIADAAVALRSAGGRLSGIIVTEATVLSSLSRKLGTATLELSPAQSGRRRRVQ